MNSLPRTKVKLEKITGPYPLLGLFLLIIESLLGFWLFRAESAVERTIAGILMVIILVVFLVVVLLLIQTQGNPPVMLKEMGGKISPAEKEATESEVESPEPDSLSAPDRSYVINKPPENWIIQELTYADWIGESWGITDESLKSRFQGINSQKSDILMFQLPHMVSVIPIPGKTLCDGSKLFSALEISSPIRLSIAPMERAQPPFFAERPFEHNFAVITSQVIQCGVVTLRRTSTVVLPDSKRRYLIAEFSQELENAVVDGKEGRCININVALIGIEGELRDYLLIMSYPSFPNEANSELEDNLGILRSIVNSFRPLKVINPEEQRRQIRKKADQKHAEIISENGTKMFFAELGLLLMRFSGLNMEEPEVRIKAIQSLKPFEAFAKEVGFEDKELEEFFDALHKAERGDTSTFKEQLSKMIETIAKGASERGTNEMLES